MGWRQRDFSKRFTVSTLPRINTHRVYRPAWRLRLAPLAAHLEYDTMNEISYILIGERKGRVWAGQLVQLQHGSPMSVTFNWEWVLNREELKGDIIGFYHTHPNGFLQPSTRDCRTMHAWAESFGKPLLCVIESEGLLGGYLFAPDNTSGVAVERIARVRNDMLVAIEGG